MAGGFNWQVALAVLVVLGVGYAFLSSGGSTGAALTVVPYSTSCSDTDGGMKTAVQGTCTDDKGSYTDVCQSAGKSVVEYFCTSTGNRCAQKPMQCSFSQTCVGGRCV